jgi:endonuclease/exonuclease/phosphatase family metal-dependent hydrolase
MRGHAGITPIGVGLVAVAALVAVRPAEARTLRVLSYNIHHSEGRDQVYDLARIASVITAAHPDLVALQELDQGNTRSGVDVFQLDRLAKLTGMQGYFGKTIDYQGGAYGNGVLVRAGLHVVQVVHRAMPSPPGGEARGLIQVDISTNGADATPEFQFFATHFTASGDQTSRLAQAAFINALVASSTVPAIVAGDFNAHPDSPVMQRRSEQWIDATAAAPANGRGSQIDYMLYRQAQSWRLPTPGNFIVDKTTQIASDHFPYLAVVELLPEPSALAMVGACAGFIVMFRPSMPHHAASTVCDALRTPPGADGDPGALAAAGAGASSAPRLAEPGRPPYQSACAASRRLDSFAAYEGGAGCASGNSDRLSLLHW